MTGGYIFLTFFAMTILQPARDFPIPGGSFELQLAPIVWEWVSFFKPYGPTYLLVYGGFLEWGKIPGYHSFFNIPNSHGLMTWMGSFFV